MPYLDAVGFGTTASIQMFDLRVDLIFVLVDWWCLKTHTFLLKFGECTISLEDFATQLRLSVDGDVVTCPSKVVEPLAHCCDLLGRSSGDGESRFTNLKISLLKENFQKILSSATESKLMCTAQASILQPTGGYWEVGDTHCLLPYDKGIHQGQISVDAIFCTRRCVCHSTVGSQTCTCVVHQCIDVKLFKGGVVQC
ncbi:hypothetical protein PVK06_011537 [Gossypium arboreum]|uniref:Aminotransferase-like plant mobile domain-containing protein n=1 Tax=Gossypium arboreum TaxID=29729 RepID=A0ABR0Q982_GOSAR|nr:hypothetical protein PVK06_011537 [Gossypium arboreum]